LVKREFQSETGQAAGGILLIPWGTPGRSEKWKTLKGREPVRKHFPSEIPLDFVIGSRVGSETPASREAHYSEKMTAQDHAESS